MRQLLTVLTLLAISGFFALQLAADGLQLQSPSQGEAETLQLDAPVLRIALRFGAGEDQETAAATQDDKPAPIAPLTAEEKEAAQSVESDTDQRPLLKLLPMNQPSGAVGSSVAPTMENRVEEATSTPPAKMPSDLPAQSKSFSEKTELQEEKKDSAEKAERPEEEPAKLKPADLEPPKEFSPELLRLQGKIRRVLDAYYRKPIDVARENPWATMHAMLPYGVDAQVRTGGRDSRAVNAIGWLCWNGKCKGQNLFYVDRGRLGARQGPGVQGHHGQFLAMLAQSYVAPSYEVRVGNERFQIADLIEFEKETCRPASELTFKLIALSYYLPIDAQWQSDDGQQWTIERLIDEELRQPVIGAACGGTHRLMGLTYAVRKRELSGEPLTGHWKRAKIFLDDYYAYTFRLQNPDGSFSTEWFEGRGAKPDLQRRLQTTGHIAEWLAYALPEEELTTPKMEKAIDYLATILERNPRMNWSIGPLGHGLHALAIYDQRVFETPPGHRSAEVASKLP
ncbi:MAG: hypothetical protein ACIALR_01625 [Blastopirellula sp. JB062]